MLLHWLMLCIGVASRRPSAQLGDKLGHMLHRGGLASRWLALLAQVANRGLRASLSGAV